MHPTILALGWASVALAHGSHDQKILSGPHKSLWYNNLPGDGGTQVGLPSLDASTPLFLTLRPMAGRLGIFWYLYLWATAILPLPGSAGCEL